MHYGANLISYPFQTTQTLEDALGDAVGNVYAIFGSGVAALVTNSGDFIGSLQAFEGGKGYWLISNAEEGFTFTFNGVQAGLTRAAEQPAMREVPDLYRFTQSSQQAFSFIESATIKNKTLDSEDIIIAYNDHGVVGSRYWSGEYTDIPMMGMDPNYTQETSSYCSEGDKITFKVLVASSGELVDMDADAELSWINMGTSIVNLVETLPLTISLNSAYPNPFNPSTTLSFTLPYKEEVLLAIYNLQGREVVSLIDRNMDAGYHSVVWNADKHSSGVYLVRMTAGSNYSKTHKLMLVK
jgi:hypothetical protein